MPSPITAPLFIIDDLIRKGRLAPARRELQAMSRRRVPRPQAAPFAILAWRLRLGWLGIRLLNPIVRPPPRSKLVASDEEKAAYAACLTQIGAAAEALAVLESINEKGLPQVLLFRVAALFAGWEYGAAIPLLHRYIESKLITDYQRVVGRVNLVAALVYEHQHAAATVLLQELVATTRSMNLNLLYLNLMELTALNAILQSQWEDAEAALAIAEKGLGGEGGLNSFMLRKWRALLGLVAGKATARSLAQISQVRKEAIERGHWETVRDCDHFRAVRCRDHALLLHVYFGTPFANFRAKLLGDFGGHPTIPDEYLRQMSEKGEAKESFDLPSGKSSAGKAALVCGDLVHRLLTTLCSDFYRPQRTATLHASMYPGQYFNPISSPVRVRQVIKRLREWIEENRLPLRIDEEEGAYRLLGTRPYAIRLSPSETPVTRMSVTLKRLQEKWPREYFSSGEASRVLEKSFRNTRRLLFEAVGQGVLERIGNKATCRYRFAAKT